MIQDNSLNNIPIDNIRNNPNKINNKNNFLNEQSTNNSENDFQNYVDTPQMTKFNYKEEKNNKITNKEILKERPVYNIPIDNIIKNKEKEDNYNQNFIIFNSKEENNIKDKIIIYEKKPEYTIPVDNIIKEKNKKLHKNKNKNKSNKNNKKNEKIKIQELNNNLNPHINNDKINKGKDNLLNNNKINLAPNRFYYNNNNSNNIFIIFNFINNLNYITNKLNEQKAQFHLLREIGLKAIMNQNNINHYLLNKYINNLI